MPSCKSQYYLVFHAFSQQCDRTGWILTRRTMCNMDRWSVIFRVVSQAIDEAFIFFFSTKDYKITTIFPSYFAALFKQSPALAAEKKKEKRERI